LPNLTYEKSPFLAKIIPVILPVQKGCPILPNLFAKKLSEILPPPELRSNFKNFCD
jgi:hypothetical protein